MSGYNYPIEKEGIDFFIGEVTEHGEKAFNGAQCCQIAFAVWVKELLMFAKVWDYRFKEFSEHLKSFVRNCPWMHGDNCWLKNFVWGTICYINGGIQYRNFFTRAEETYFKDSGISNEESETFIGQHVHPMLF